MNGQLSDTVLPLGLLALPYLLAVCMPSLRWLGRAFAGVAGLASVMLAYVWIAAAPTDHALGIGDYIIVSLILLAAAPFAIGVLVRALTLWLAATGLRRSALIAISVVGYALVPILLYAPQALHLWLTRAPSHACRQAVFDVTVAGARFALPAAGVFDIEADQRYQLWSNAALRALCSHTNNGRKPLAADAIAINLRGPLSAADRVCAAAPAPDDGGACAANLVLLADRTSGLSRVRVSAAAPPDDWDRFRTDAPLAPPVRIASTATTPDGAPLAFDCRPERGGLRCEARAPWRGGAWLAYTFWTRSDDVAAHGGTIDGAVRRVLDALSRP